ncbi:Putative CTL8 isoform A, partial [Gryllus bimaculatus]
ARHRPCRGHPQPRPRSAPSPAPARRRSPRAAPPPHDHRRPHAHQARPAPPVRDNEVPDSAHVRNTGSPGANLVPPLEEERREPGGARLNLGAIIALGVFGGFVFLAAIITTIVILIRRSRSAKHYRHRASPDCNTVASFDSSGSEGRAGLNRYYRQAWENLHHQAGGGGGGKNALRRQETLDEPVRGAGELLVTTGMSKPAPPQQEKKRHHHHHHHHGPSSSGTKETSNAAGDWRNRPSKNRY